MALKRVFAGFYTRYDGKPIFVVRVLKDIDTGELKRMKKLYAGCIVTISSFAFSLRKYSQQLSESRQLCRDLPRTS